jgi:nitroreductase
MPTPDSAALNFLLTRRSRPAKTLRAPAPSRAELMPILQAAARCPDHGKLEPWRFVVLSKPALERLAGLVPPLGEKLGIAEDKIIKQEVQFATADLAVAVIASPKASDKVPESEQLLSAGACCLSLLNAALAAGWGANWLTGWASHEREFLTEGLDLAPHETLAGFIHIGTETAEPPDRPRPDLEQITTWLDA